MDGLSAPAVSHLVTIDIECLYNSIPHAKGLETITTYLDQMNSDQAPFNKFILKLLDFILNHNVFLVDEQPYLQTQGVAMGTPCAPSYANLYLWAWERDLFSSDDLTMYLCHAMTCLFQIHLFKWLTAKLCS